MSYGLWVKTSNGNIQIDDTHPIMVYNQYGYATCSTSLGGNYYVDVSYTDFVAGRHLHNTLIFARPRYAPTDGNARIFSGASIGYAPIQGFRFQSPTDQFELEYVFLAPSQYTDIIDIGDYGMEVYGPLGSLIFSSNMVMLYPLVKSAITPYNGTVLSYFTTNTWSTSAPFVLMNSSYACGYSGSGSTWTLDGPGIHCSYQSPNNYLYQTWPYSFSNINEDDDHEFSQEARIWATAGYPGMT